MKEVVQKEVVKMLEAVMIYPILDNKWVSPVQVVLKKEGMTVIMNDNSKLIPTIAVTSWRNLPFELMCDASDYAVGAILVQKREKEFDLEIRDKSGKDNLVANHLSRLINDEVTKGKREIAKVFLDLKLFLIQDKPWFADIANYKASEISPDHFNYQQSQNFLKEVNHYV
ncbi:PREDICTED: uncharacterized protein LOC109340420 [Lupinus angustifolius]|uniref:uncharacterized protein LOC109340420 n=1 Tax=Lupinus angustifolius TaxID=3871 RepID=UPI00092EB85A|nr:PREDICTED: uncharacterized protein LOC109340420 [Lupinus angustifolius]